MSFVRFDVQNSSLTVACRSPSLLYEQCQRRALVQQAQFARRLFAVPRIEEDPARNEYPVEIGNKGARITQRTGTIRRCSADQMFNVLLDICRPATQIRQVGADIIAAYRTADVCV